MPATFQIHVAVIPVVWAGVHISLIATRLYLDYMICVYTSIVSCYRLWSSPTCEFWG